MTTPLIIKGSLATFRGENMKRRKRLEVGRGYASAIDSAFRHGTTKAALSTTNVDRTLGASTRQGWRLSCGAADRAAHNATTTDNNAAYVAVSQPLAYVARKDNKRVKETDRL